MRMRSPSTVKDEGLVCSECGNKRRFIEVMAEEAHVVNGSRTYIRLLEGIVDHYTCCDCGATLESEPPRNV